jgi:hypothetical protein
MDDGDSRPPTRPASPSVFVEEPQSLLRILSPLHRATEEDDIRRVMEILAAGADVNEKATDGRTPLHVCAQANNTVMAEVLLYKSASIKVVDHAGKDPLRIALDTGSTEMACMLLSRGGPLDALSGFIVDAVQLEQMPEKRLILTCLGFVAKEEKVDELLELLSTSTQGAPASLENALMEILHDAEPSYDKFRLAKSFADRKVKTPVASTEQENEIGHESDSEVQATHTQPEIRSLEEAGESELVQGLETPTKREENHTRSPEPNSVETPNNDASSGIADSGTSAQSTSTPATNDGGSQILPERWAQTKTFGYRVDDLGDNIAQHEFVSLPAPRTEPSEELESVVYDTEAASESRSGIIKPDSDAPTSVKTASADTVPFKALLHKQFSWEIAGSNDITSASTTEHRADSEQATELCLTAPPSPSPPPPAGHVFCVPLQDLCNRQQLPVPQIVLDCISILEHSASDLSGIYQYPPEPRLVERLKEFVEAGELHSRPHDYQMLISIRFTTNGIRRHMAKGAQGGCIRSSETVPSRTTRFASNLRLSRRFDGAGSRSKAYMSPTAQSHHLRFTFYSLRHIASDNAALEKGVRSSKTSRSGKIQLQVFTRCSFFGEQGNRGNVCAPLDPPCQDHPLDWHKWCIADCHCELDLK